LTSLRGLAHILEVLFFVAIVCATVAFGQNANIRGAPAPGAVEGRVINAQGAPVAGASVEVTGSDNRIKQTAATGADGLFRFNNLPPGQYRVRITAEGYAETNLTVELTESKGSQLEVTLKVAPIAETMTITASRIEQRRSDVIGNIVVIGRDGLERTASRTLDDTLRQIPGFSLFRRSNSLVAHPTTQGVSLRGIGPSGASRTVVLADGIPINDPFGGWVYWGRIARAAVEQVEVMRGGASDLYGSDALGGVIHLRTRQPSQSALRAEGSYGTRGTGDFSLFAGHKLGRWGLSLSSDLFRTGGYAIVAPKDRGPADIEARSEHRTVEVTAEYAPSASKRLYFRGARFSEDRGNGTRIQVNDTEIWSGVIGGQWRLSERNEWSGYLYANRLLFNSDFSAVAAGRASETLNRRQQVPARAFGLSLQWARKLGPHQHLVAAVEGREVHGFSNEEVFAAGRATTAVSNGGRQRSSAAFIHDIINIGRGLQLALSLRLDHWRNFDASSASRALPSGQTQTTLLNSKSETALSPKLSLRYHATDRVALRGAFYRAFRAPTLNELYRPFRVGDVLTTANENLGAEHLTGGEGGIDLALGRSLEVRATAFWSRVNDPVANVTIRATPTLITRQRQNLGAIRARGIEAEVEYRPGQRWRFASSYLFDDAIVLRFPADRGLEGLAIPQVPRHQLVLQASYAAPEGVTAAIQSRFVGSQFDDDRNLFPLSRFSVTDIFLSYPLARAVEVFGAMENLFNSTYAVGKTPIETIGAPRLMRTGVRIHF